LCASTNHRIIVLSTLSFPGGIIKKRFFFPDVHAPFHDRKCVELALDVLKDLNPDEVVILGDFFDCYTVSQYSKDPKSQYKLLEEELAEGRTLLSRIIKTAPRANIVFLQGNHEYRIDRYVSTYANALGGSINTRDVLQLPKQVKWYPYGHRNHHQCGKLIATHGTICNRHCCAAMLQKYGCSVIFGHTHRMQEFNIRKADGERIKAVTIGWLGDKDSAAEYVQNVHDFSHGFAVGHFKPNGDFFLDLIEIEKYQLVFQGKFYG
jgi:UDP-2,3-diacylglucosamine pyrophosphatase LpxH